MPGVMSPLTASSAPQPNISDCSASRTVFDQAVTAAIFSLARFCNSRNC